MKLFPLPATGWGLGLFAYLYLTRLKIAIQQQKFLIPQYAWVSAKPLQN
jgi:hypothetical protein